MLPLQQLKVSSILLVFIFTGLSYCSWYFATPAQAVQLKVSIFSSHRENRPNSVHQNDRLNILAQFCSTWKIWTWALIIYALVFSGDLFLKKILKTHLLLSRLLFMASILITQFRTDQFDANALKFLFHSESIITLTTICCSAFVAF